jgi:uroporphyrinogen-III decarboxylase
MPIGTHLVLHEHADAAAIELDGARLGAVVAEAARRFQTPLALPLMDLTLEKSALLAVCGVVESESEPHHFREVPRCEAGWALTPRMAATCEAIRYVAQGTDLVPVGMCIGPFSLTTKLVADPITPVFLSGSGGKAAEDPEVALVEGLLPIATRVVLDYVEAQAAAGAKALIVCEPAANKVFFSPNQLARSYEGFERFVMEPNRRVRERLADHGIDLVFHNCGELVDGMVTRFAGLDPAILSLGSSRRLWEDAALVPRSTVLYGNLPTKRFYSDALSVAEVERLAVELRERMRAITHPFILGSECDVLSVPGSEETIREKVETFMR